MAEGSRAKKNFYTFTGREYLERLGMYDYRARVYDPRATASSILASGKCRDVCIRIRADCRIKWFKIRCNFSVSNIFGRACIRF